MLYVCVGDDGCFVGIVSRGAVGASVKWECRHADVCLCLVCILWQSSLLRSA